MRGRTIFVAVSGIQQDERVVRIDNNTAKVIGDIRYGKYYIFYQVVTSWAYVEYKDITWAYRRLEDVQRKLCHGQTGMEIHTIMLVIKSGKRVGIPVGSEENAITGLNIIKSKNPFTDIGYIKEKEGRYL